jgi:two-component system sensor histidine kinase KdpD
MLFTYFFIVILNGILTSRVRRQERMTREREEKTRALYQLNLELSSASGVEEVLKVSVKDIQKYFQVDSAIIMQSGQKELEKEIRHGSELLFSEAEMSIATWTYYHSRKAGKFTDTLPSTAYTFYPLNGTRHKMGVIAVKQNKAFKGDEEIFWDTFRTQISNALEREFLDELARKTLILDESEKLYKTLFNLPGLEPARIACKKDWLDIHDLLNKVTGSLSSELEHFNLETVVQEDIPLVFLDFGLMEQVLYNLVINAVQYSPQDTTIRIKMYYEKPHFVMQVMDRGPGFPKDEILHVFNRFYRIPGAKTGSTGLGLPIVKEFVEAHNGTVEIENRKNGGARITVRIPSEIPDP